MADIRINSLSSTASTTASDDYIAIDGSANGTRKLSAYSPTFGGNVTVSGTMFGGNLTVSGTINPFVVGSGYTGFAGSVGILGGNGFFIQGKTGTTYDFAVGNNGGSIAFGVPAGTTNVAVVGNLTVAGTGAVNGAASIGALSVATTSETLLTGPLFWSNKHVVLGGLANSTTASGLGISVNQSDNSIYTFALSPSIAYRDIYHQAKTHNWHLSGSATAAMALTSAGNLSLTGNLTVSGTGTSSVAGSLSIGPSAAGRGNLVLSTPSANTSLIREAVSGHLDFQAYDYRFKDDTGSSTFLTLNAVGNLLVGTTTDSSNGKLQLATHTTSAGGIGLGTSVSLFTSSTNNFEIYCGGSRSLLVNALGIYAGFSGSAAAPLWSNANGVSGIYYTSAGQAINFSSNGTLALTLDSSQNATFAGTGTQIFNGSLRLPNNKSIIFLTTGAASCSALTLNGSDNLALGQSNANHGATIIYGGTGNVQIYAATSLVATFKTSGVVNMGNLPTSSSGLSAGDIWNDSGTLKIV